MHIIKKDGEIKEIEIKEGFIINSFGNKDRVFFRCFSCGIETSKTVLTLKRYTDETKKISINNERAFSCSKCNTIKTNMEKYGVKSVLSLPLVRSSYLPPGIKNVSQLPEIKAKKKKAYEKKTEEEKKAIYEKANFTHMEKYGMYYTKTDEYKNNLKEKIGVENVFQLDSSKKKSRESQIKKYGDIYSKTQECRDKTRETNISKYGVDSPMKDKAIREKSISNKFDKHGWVSWFSTEEFKKTTIEKNFNKIKEMLEAFNIEFVDTGYKGTRPKDVNEIYLFKCNTCGKEFEDNIHSKVPRCPVCFPKYQAIAEKELFAFLAKYDEKIEISNRSILGGKELDIYLPSKKIAIEHNGLYWHSETTGRKEKLYHKEKFEACKEKGIKLFHIFGDEWIFKKDIVKSIISSYLGDVEKIYARKTIIKEVSKKESDCFFDVNHIQGSAAAKYHIGLFYDEKLVSCISLSTPRFNKKYDLEIVRYATIIGFSVIGGFSKLFSYVRKNISFENLITYSDLRLFSGEVYKNNGFSFFGNTSPNYYYLNKNYTDRTNRIYFQKHKLEGLLESFNKNLTEWENMQLNGYDRIWDCGNSVFLYKNSCPC